MSEIVFDPQNVADCFAEIMKLPHESGKENPLRAAVFTWLTDPRHGIGLSPANVFYDETATDPGKRVIYAFRPGSKSSQPIILQAHLDMVVVTDPQGVAPFPLQPAYDVEGWLQARANGSPDTKSSLGADNGVGIAIALALLQDSELKDYPIECLFTVQEETDMAGAQLFDTGLLKGRTFINVDSEEAGIITYGSAGGFKTKYMGATAREKMSPTPAFVKILLGGLRGGHSGVDIAKGRPNALKLLVDGLCRMNERISGYTLPPGTLPQSYDFRLVSLARTDTIKSNAIPTEATAILAVAADDAIPLLKSFEEWFNALQILYGSSEQNMRIELTSIAETPYDDPLTADATDNLLCFLRLVPQGVIGLIPGYDPAVVETSSNLYDVSLDGATMRTNTFSRTSNPVLLGSVEAHDQTPMMAMFKSLGAMYGLTVTTAIEWSPAWPPNQDSHLLATAEKIYASAYPGYEISVIHAGLECGWIASRCPDMDCISVGPTYNDGHTVDERLDTSSVKGFYDAIKGVMLALFQEEQPEESASIGEPALANA
jgi:dipeptidase D